MLSSVWSAKTACSSASPMPNSSPRSKDRSLSSGTPRARRCLRQEAGAANRCAVRSIWRSVPSSRWSMWSCVMTNTSASMDAGSRGAGAMRVCPPLRSQLSDRYGSRQIEAPPQRMRKPPWPSQTSSIAMRAYLPLRLLLNSIPHRGGLCTALFSFPPLQGAKTFNRIRRFCAFLLPLPFCTVRPIILVCRKKRHTGRGAKAPLLRRKKRAFFRRRAATFAGSAS